MKRFVSVAVLSVAVFGFAACGSDKEAAKSISKADFIKQADEICKATDEATDKLGSPKSAEDLLKLVPKAAQIEIDAIAEIRALGTPDADGDKITKLFDDVEAAFEKLKGAKSADDLEGLASKLEPLSGSAEKLGFKECGSNG